MLRRNKEGILAMPDKRRLDDLLAERGSNIVRPKRFSCLLSGLLECQA